MTVGTVWLQLKAAELVQSLAGTAEEQTDGSATWLCWMVQYGCVKEYKKKGVKLNPLLFLLLFRPL